jgi:hypothetical protein
MYGMAEAMPLTKAKTQAKQKPNLYNCFKNLTASHIQQLHKQTTRLSTANSDN